VTFDALAGSTATSTARESERIDALIDLGIDSPLKLDLLSTVEQAGGGFGRAETLAALCGASYRDATPTLDALADAGLIARRRFYNISEYGAGEPNEVRDRIRSLLFGVGPVEMRRLRRALLARSVQPAR
jgi:hypothetical protein